MRVLQLQMRLLKLQCHYFGGDVESQDSNSMCKLKPAGFSWPSGDSLKIIWVYLGCVLDEAYPSSQSKVSQVHAKAYYFRFHTTVQ